MLGLRSNTRENTVMTSISAPARRALFALLAVCVALVIAALIAVSLRPAHHASDPNSPQGVVQQYIAAVQNKNVDLALSLTDGQERNQLCDYYAEDQQDVSVQLVRETVTDDSAIISVTIGTPDQDLFMLFGGYSYESEFNLKMVNGQWKIVTTPWEFELCTAEELGK